MCTTEKGDEATASPPPGGQVVQVRVRALQVQTRIVEQAGDDGLAPVDHLEYRG